MKLLSVWFSGLRLKLLGLVALPAVLMIGSTYYTSVQMEAMRENLERTSLVTLPLADEAGNMETSINGTLRYVWTAYASEDQENITKALARADAQMKDHAEARARYIKLPRPEAMQKLFAPVQDNWEQIVPLVKEASALIEKRSPAHQKEAYELMITKIRPLANSLGETLNKMGQIRRENAEKAAHATIAAANNSMQVLRLVSGIGVLSIGLFGLILASRLASVLGHTTGQLSEAGSQVSSASSQLSSASQQVSAGATQAASSLAETVASTEVLSSMVKLNSDNAKQAAALAQTSCDSAEEGEREIKNLIESMTDISTSSKKIEEIINVIDDIAFQTNLLALNAAVEAARAGEQGKGFAVVAEAVRTLAARSASAAKDINGLIKESVHKIEKGSKVADSSGSVLKNIVTSIKKVSDLNSEIASASAEQANGISQITKAMNELDRATQQNASASEEVAASSEEMSAQAMTLQSLVRDLMVLVDGGKAEHMHAPTQTSHRAPIERNFAQPRRPGAQAGRHTGRHVGRTSAQVIPFDDDEKYSKVGTTDGF